MKKVIVVYIGEIMHCPPALSLVQVLNDLKMETLLCTIGDDLNGINKAIGNLRYLKIEFVGSTYSSKLNLFMKFIRMFLIRRNIWNVLKKYDLENSIVWIVSEGSLKHLGKKILKTKYILHLLELNEGIYYISGNPILKLDYKNYAKKASVLVEAEYNRAHITKAWWELDDLPMVLPNKPYNIMDIDRYSDITSDSKVAELMKKLRNKKIILYQGNISKERPLQEYVKAVGELGDEYVFLMMINGENPYPELKYDNFICMPFINPPYHLEITSHAYIGILSYTPIKNSYSILNTLYCAPNKVWEYAKFGIPMIGNDLPALKQLFLEYKSGVCLPDISKEEIKIAIKKIEESYEEYSKASLGFFDSANLKDIISDILKHC